MLSRRIRVAPPFRLDLTAALLRRFEPRPGGVYSAAYVRAIPQPAGPIAVAIAQVAPDALEVRVESAAADLASICVCVRRMLGTDTDVEDFTVRTRGIPWLRSLASRMSGVRPARFPSVWEAGVNAIAFQSVSMASAAAVLARWCAQFGTCEPAFGLDVDVFPTPQAILAASDCALPATGLSRAKVTALRALAETFAADLWNEERLGALPTPELCRELCRVRGIGPWSAAVIALRGFGRLDTFPAADTGVIRTVAALSGSRTAAEAALHALGPTRGMLYHLLLLARLDAHTPFATAADAATTGAARN